MLAQATRRPQAQPSSLAAPPTWRPGMPSTGGPATPAMMRWSLRLARPPTSRPGPTEQLRGTMSPLNRVTTFPPLTLSRADPPFPPRWEGPIPTSWPDRWRRRCRRRAPGCRLRRRPWRHWPGRWVRGRPSGRSPRTRRPRSRPRCRPGAGRRRPGRRRGSADGASGRTPWRPSLGRGAPGPRTRGSRSRSLPFQTQVSLERAPFGRHPSEKDDGLGVAVVDRGGVGERRRRDGRRTPSTR